MTMRAPNFSLAVVVVVVVVLAEVAAGGAPPGMVWDGQKGWVPEEAQQGGMMTLGGEEDLLTGTATQQAGLMEASELSVELAKESMLEVNAGGLSEQEALEAAVLAEAIAAPLIGANGEDRSVPAPREDSGAGRRDDVRDPARMATEEFVPSAAEFIPGADLMPEEEDPAARAVREETEAAMIAQQDALDAAKAKIDRLHASLAQGKAPPDMTAPPQGATTKMKRVAGGRTPVGDMDANRASLLGGAATGDGADGGGDSMDPDEARRIQEQVQAKREEVMLMREMARSRMRRGGNGGDDLSPMERDHLRQQARAEERRQPGWEPSHGYGASAEERLAQARAKRDRVAPPPLSEPPPPPSTAQSTAGEGVWYQVDGGGAVAFRSKPEKNARTKVVAEAHTLVYAVADPAAPEGWIKTNTELWLPSTFLIGPLGDRDGPSIAEAAEAHAAHAALAAAEGYVRGPVAPPPVTPPAPAPEPSWATGCIDIDWKCNLWAASGECEADAAFMAKKCRLACGLCTPTESDSAGSAPGTAMLEDLYAKAKAELPPPPPYAGGAAATSVGGEKSDVVPGAAPVDDEIGPPPSLEGADGGGGAAIDEVPAADAQDPVSAPKLRTIRRSSSGSGSSGGGTQRRTLSSRPTKLVTKSPSLKQELERTRQAAPKLETMARPELKGDGRAAPAAASDPMNPSDLPSTLEDERAWLRAEKQRLQKEQDDVARALAEAGQPAGMGMGMGMGSL
jgi:hypothetical protein